MGPPAGARPPALPPEPLVPRPPRPVPRAARARSSVSTGVEPQAVDGQGPRTRIQAPRPPGPLQPCLLVSLAPCRLGRHAPMDQGIEGPWYRGIGVASVAGSLAIDP